MQPELPPQLVLLLSVLLHVETGDPELHPPLALGGVYHMLIPPWAPNMGEGWPTGPYDSNLSHNNDFILGS